MNVGRGGLSIAIKHQFIVECVRDVDPGARSIDNVILKVRKGAPKYFGARMVASEIYETASQGFIKISALAAKGGDCVGYNIWPLMGFEAKLPRSIISELPKSLEGSKTLLDLTSTPAGQAWWKANGQTIKVEFDLTEGSRSMLRLQAFLAQRGIQL